MNFICSLVVVAFLALANGVKSEGAVQAQRGEAPYVAFVYHRADDGEGAISGRIYTAVLVRPTLLISGDCCGPSQRKNPVARLGALTVRSDNTEDDLEQERTVVNIAKLRGGTVDGGVALLVGEPFQLTPVVSLAALATTATQPGQTCYLYQFSHAAGDSDLEARTLQRRSVRALTPHNCSGQEASNAICFEDLDTLVQKDVVASVEGGAVSCDGTVVALVGAEARSAARAHTSPRQYVDAAAWRQVALCSDASCLDTKLEPSVQSLMALYDDETTAAPSKKALASATVNPIAHLVAASLLTSVWLKL